MRVIGIDPGTRIAGYGVVEERAGRSRALVYGAVITDAQRPAWERLQQIYHELSILISRWQPDACAVEAVLHGKNFQTALRIGEGRATALLAATSAGLSVHEYSPTMVKKAATGTGGATKAQVQQMVRVILGLEAVPEPEDAADALAIALCHLHRAR